MCISQGAEMLMHLAGAPYLHVALAMGGVPANREFVDKIVPMLLQAGAQWVALDRFGCTAVHVAAQHGLVEYVRAGVEAEAELLMAVDAQQRTPLHYAALYVAAMCLRACSAWGGCGVVWLVDGTV